MQLKAKQEGKKVNLFIFSLAGGKTTIPQDAKTVLGVFEEAYEMTDKISLMLVAFPFYDVFHGDLRNWLEKMDKVNADNNLVDLTITNSGFRLRKLPNSPETLFIIK
jgi:hypothetical protein